MIQAREGTDIDICSLETIKVEAGWSIKQQEIQQGDSPVLTLTDQRCDWPAGRLACWSIKVTGGTHLTSFEPTKVEVGQPAVWMGVWSKGEGGLTFGLTKVQVEQPAGLMGSWSKGGKVKGGTHSPAFDQEGRED